MWAIDICDRAGRRRAFAHDHDGFTVTRRLDGHASLGFAPLTTGRAAAELAVAERTVKLWDDGELRFHGPVWEPLVYGPVRVETEARDPLATLPWRRVRVETTYSATDAGLIAFDRLDVQNGYAPTGLVPGERDPSVSRDRTYPPGKREDEILDQLAGVEDGFFYRARPVDHTPGVYAELDILYPDAGTTRLEVRFEYGERTMANLDDFQMTRRLPLNRFVVASVAPLGGRIARVAEDADSIARFGIFGDEQVYSDITVEDTLGQHARAGVRPLPPRTFSLTPGPAAPLLFRDFDVGDFVRLRILHGPLDLLLWVRVLEATLRVDREGVETLEGLVVETLIGGEAAEPHDPRDMFRRLLDEDRRRLEELERRFAAFDQTPLTPDPEPSPEAPGGGTPGPSEPAPPPPPPPPAPPAPPSLGNLQATAAGAGAIACSVDANGNGSDTTVWFTVDGAPFGHQGIGTGFAAVGGSTGGLAEGTYSIAAHASSAGGSVSTGPVNVFVPFSPHI